MTEKEDRELLELVSRIRARISEMVFAERGKDEIHKTYRDYLVNQNTLPRGGNVWIVGDDLVNDLGQ